MMIGEPFHNSGEAPFYLSYLQSAFLEKKPDTPLYYSRLYISAGKKIPSEYSEEEENEE